ncbi:MAG: translation initiation factor IF-5A [Thermoproteus sp.]|jgi:translation initiation factor 5A|nr:MAG: translation initiation factor IF-5A [Thermoproteus sp. CIS_19]KUO88027.1 MAG: translation initiation factor IF-5A [Thermoproteus sp. JCHS_4]MCI4464967.1 translation initiation factor IF-5A [Thermoproteus sp.]MDT7868601.1 translation initiation factor IF-5A [Thermoproteus sp.]MDT7881186.1 translation initiation factor IF-5A [Thermoproteus sp.]
MSTKYVEVGELKEGSYIVIDGEPCRVVEIEKSKTGKHGSAKARVVAVGLFDNVKRTLSVPVDTQVEVPIIEKFTAQILAISGDTIQLMDMRDYKTLEVPLKYVEDEAKGKLASGAEVEVWQILDRYKITRVK